MGITQHSEREFERAEGGMKLQVTRYVSSVESTLGLLHDVTQRRAKKFLAYTLEDEYRTVKVFGETRIPAGTYEVTLRTTGGHHARYAKKFAAIHDGMLWLQDVPNFKYILIHIGNTDDDTAGCLLVGSAPKHGAYEDRLVNSTQAYRRVYLHVVEALNKGERVDIEYVDFDR